MNRVLELLSSALRKSSDGTELEREVGKVESEMPIFYQIKSVVIVKDTLLLLTLPLTFHEHFHAYEVTKRMQGFVVFDVNIIPSPLTSVI